MGSLLAMAKKILAKKKKNRPIRRENLSFSSFLFRYRPEFDYSSGYAFLQWPTELALSGESLAVRKGSQLGLTELALSLSLFWLCREESIFYMLPTDRDIVDFCAARFDPILQNSEQLQRLIEIDNVHLKRVGAGAIYLRPGMTRAGKPTSKIKSVPVKRLIIDEVDEIPAITLEIVSERLSGSVEKQEILFSTPTAQGRGISKSMQGRRIFRYFLTCRSCGHEQNLTLEENLDIENETYRCSKCRVRWTQEEKIEMIRRAAKTGWRQVEGPPTGKIGIEISQLYSPTVTASEVCEKFRQADNDLALETFYNHKLGLPFSSSGSRLDSEFVDRAVFVWDCPDRGRIAGIDVATGGLHYVIVVAPTDAGPVICEAARVSWNNLPAFLRVRGVACAVIDSMPERHAAREFAVAFAGQTWLAQYPQGMRELFRQDEKSRIVSVHRTEALDIVLARFREEKICILPRIAEGEEYRHLRAHVLSVSRKYREVRGAHEAFYEESGADHYLHALVYAEIAGRISKPILDIETGKFI